MSHIAKIELEINSLEDLKAACIRLGFVFQENQNSYTWYGRWVGDSPLPEGINIDDLGKCDHAIKIPECAYEIGVVKRGYKYTLLWDSWHRGGLEQKIGKGCRNIKTGLYHRENQAGSETEKVPGKRDQKRPVYKIGIKGLTTRHDLKGRDI